MFNNNNFFALLIFHIHSQRTPYLCVYRFVLDIFCADILENCAETNSKSVKQRDDWRKRSKPIPPGGNYPAKDHCRSVFYHFLESPFSHLFFWWKNCWCLLYWNAWNGLEFFVLAANVGCVTLIILPMSRMHVLSWEMECLELKWVGVTLCLKLKLVSCLKYCLSVCLDVDICCVY